MLTPEQQRINELMGINPHEFIEANRDNLAALQQQGLSDSAQEALLQRALDDVAKAMKISPHELKKLQEQHDSIRLTVEEIEACKKLNVHPVDYLETKMKAAGITEYLGMKLK